MTPAGARASDIEYLSPEGLKGWVQPGRFYSFFETFPNPDAVEAVQRESTRLTEAAHGSNSEASICFDRQMLSHYLDALQEMYGPHPTYPLYGYADPEKRTTTIHVLCDEPSGFIMTEEARFNDAVCKLGLKQWLDSMEKHAVGGVDYYRGARQLIYDNNTQPLAVKFRLRILGTILDTLFELLFSYQHSFPGGPVHDAD